MDWKNIIGSVAPVLGTALGGPFGGAATKWLAGKLLGDENASESDLADAVLRASPEKLAEIKRLDNDFEVKMKELGIERDKLQLARDTKQIELNTQEVKSNNLFKSGWRPAVGWTCALGFGYATMIYPTLTWLATVNNWPTPPVLETGLIITVLGGMLGIGGMRSWEKKQGLAR